MAGLKEIKRRLRSVKNTSKITYAMKLVSAARLRKAQDAVLNFHVFTDGLNQLLAQLMAERGDGELSHPLLNERAEVKNICFLVVGGRRGLCGSYNTALHKKIESVYQEKREAQPQATLHSHLIGKKPADYFRRIKRECVKSYEELPEDPSRWPIREMALEFKEQFLNGTYDEVWVIYTRFKSAITHPPICEKLLPLSLELETSPHHPELAVLSRGMTLFEPSIGEVFDAVLPDILLARVWQACLDAKASETASRMTAMDSATRNAGLLGKKLELLHNKVRQARITSELLDIIGGSGGVK
jgi:F-type H+-transporting ATPase subunit gamma